MGRLGSMTSLHTLVVLVALVGPEPSPPAAETVARPIELARLRELLYSRQSPQEQSQAALLLVQNLSTEAEQLVAAGLRQHDRPDVFQALAAAIRLRGDTRFLDSLFAALGSEQAPVRQAASDSLARLDNAIVLRKLLSLAEDASASATARQAAVATLGRSMQKSAAIALVSLLSSESAAVRQATAAALEELTGQAYGSDAFAWQNWWEQVKDLSEEEWLAARTSYFADRARRLRDDLAQAENHILQLQQTLYGKIPAADRPSHLRTLTQSNYAAVRVQAASWVMEALAEADGAEKRALMDLLLALSDDGVEAVQRQAVLALEKVKDPRAFERLLALLQAGTVNVRAAAARSLGRYSSQKADESEALRARAIAALDKALGDPSLVVVAEAAESLGSLGVPETAPILAGLLKHPADQVRQAAARALELVANPDVLSDLLAALDDPVPSVRFSLVGALSKVCGTAKLGEKQKADVLQRLQLVLVRDGDPGVRSRAATVVGDHGTPAELPILWQRVQATEDNRVQLKAWTAMIEILGRSANWALLSEWDQRLAEPKEAARRVELLTEVRHRWLKLGAAKPHLDALTVVLVEAQLAQKKWAQALPLAKELAKKAATEAELHKALRWLLVAGNQAVDDRKPQEALLMLKDIHELLSRSKDLAAEFEALRQRALQAREN